MCLYNYNKENKKYKHLTYAERTMIERWYNKEHLSKKQIAKNLAKSERTIRRKIKRGLTKNLKTYLEEKKVYSADIAQEAYEANLEAKGQELKTGSNIEIIKLLERMIKEERKSPEVVAYELTDIFDKYVETESVSENYTERLLYDFGHLEKSWKDEMLGGKSNEW